MLRNNFLRTRIGASDNRSDLAFDGTSNVGITSSGIQAGTGIPS